MTIPPQQFSNQDTLTGLLTVSAWSNQCANGRLPGAGSLIACDIVGLGSVTQKYGSPVGEALLREIVQRIQRALPRNGALVRGSGNTLFAWLPSATDTVAQEFIRHLRTVICNTPVALPGVESVLPKLLFAALPIAAQTRVVEAVQALERELVRQPEFSAPPSGVTRAISVRDEIDHRLSAMALFGRDGLVEQILANLRLPAPLAVTVVVSGPAQAGKTRLLATVGKLLGGQRLPLAEVTGRPSDQAIPCSLLAAMLYQFLTAYPPDMLAQYLGPICQAHPWVRSLFHMLAEEGNAPAPPDDPATQRQVFESLLLELVRMAPHIAIIHDLHQADATSLAVLADVQGMSGHGLRIIAGVELSEGQMPAVVTPFLNANATTLPVEPFTCEQVRLYLRELIPELAPDELVEQLFAITDGLPLALDYTLRAWAADGTLDFSDGQWAYHPERSGTSASSGLQEPDLARLRRLALAGPVTLDLLADWWKTTPEETQRTIDHGRAFGYLKPMDFNQPELVEFFDQDHAAALTQALTHDERTAIHAEIAALFQSAYQTDPAQYARDLAYHFTQAGELSQAQQYLQYLHLSLATLTPILVTPQAPMGGIEAWDIPPASPIEINDVDPIIEAALALRLTGVQFRLYPPTSELVRFAVREAMTALEALFRNRASLIITFDGRTIAFDGQIMTRRDLQVAVKDFYAWMSEGNLRAIGIAAGVREYELARFLQAMATYEPKDLQSNLLNRIALLNLTNIKVLTRSFQPDLPQMNMPLGGGGLFPPPPAPHLLPQNPATPIAAPAESSDRSVPGLPPVLPSLRDFLPRSEDETDMPPTLSEPELLTDESWAKLPEILETASASTRRTMMANLARWLGEQEEQHEPELLQRIDNLLAQRLQQEDDRNTLRDTLAGIEHRLDTLLAQQRWDEILSLLEPIYTRLQQDPSSDMRRQLALVLDRVGERLALQGLLTQIVEQPQHLEQARRVVTILGERSLRPLIDALKSNTVMQERNRIMQLLREFGSMQETLLIEELHRQNPWYVYRNLLQVLAEIGTDDSLPIIGEMIMHADHRVRAESVNAAVRIARERATAYLAQGLDDTHELVRARAASLVSFCPEPRILEILLRMLERRLGGEEAESVQLTACLGLGYFQDDRARETLLQILHPRFFSAYRKMGDQVRNATVTALADHLPHPAVIAAIKQATSDKHPLVRQTAQRIWRQYQAQQNSEASA